MKHTRDASSGAGASTEVPPSAEALAVVRRLGVELTGVAPDLAPERVPGHLVRDVSAALTTLERQARGLRMVLRKAAADTGDWRAKGHKSPAEQVAKEEGISVGQAKAEIEASARLGDQPEARDAVARGEISPESAAVVSQGAAADPSAESGLVRMAKRGDLQATRRRAQEAITRADERSGEQAKRIRARRSLRTWVSLDGEGHGVWNIPAESQGIVMAALEPYRKAAFQAARASGEPFTNETLYADALEMLARDVLLDNEVDAGEPSEGPATGTATTGHPNRGHGAAPAVDTDEGFTTEPSLFDADGPDAGSVTASGARTPASSRSTDDGSDEQAAAVPEREPKVVPMAGRRPSTPAPWNRRAPAQVHVLVDFDVLRRGYAVDGETCEIHGIGPIPARMAEHLMQDALLRLIVTGTDITMVSSHRRYIPEAVRRALFARDKGCCVVCGSDRYLELHHFVDDFAKGCPTEYGTLAHVCSREHALITHCGWTLHQTDAGWEFQPPHDNGDTAGKDPP